MTSPLLGETGGSWSPGERNGWAMRIVCRSVGMTGEMRHGHSVIFGISILKGNVNRYRKIL